MKSHGKLESTLMIMKGIYQDLWDSPKKNFTACNGYIKK